MFLFVFLVYHWVGSMAVLDNIMCVFGKTSTCDENIVKRGYDNGQSAIFFSLGYIAWISTKEFVLDRLAVFFYGMSVVFHLAGAWQLWQAYPDVTKTPLNITVEQQYGAMFAYKLTQDGSMWMFVFISYALFMRLAESSDAANANANAEPNMKLKEIQAPKVNDVRMPEC